MKIKTTVQLLGAIVAVTSISVFLYTAYKAAYKNNDTKKNKNIMQITGVASIIGFSMFAIRKIK